MNRGNQNKPLYETGEVRIGVQSPGSDWIKIEGQIIDRNTALGQQLFKAGYFSWTTQTSTFTSSGINSVVYDNGFWLAGGEFGRIRTSTDAVTWVTQTSQFGSTFIQSVAYGNGLWVAGGDSGTLRTSTDAVTWVTQTSQFGTSRISSVAYGNGLWVAGGAGGTLRTVNSAALPNLNFGYNISGWIKQ